MTLSFSRTTKGMDPDVIGTMDAFMRHANEAGAELTHPEFNAPSFARIQAQYPHAVRNLFTVRKLGGTLHLRAKNHTPTEYIENPTELTRQRIEKMLGDPTLE